MPTSDNKSFAQRQAEAASLAALNPALSKCKRCNVPWANVTPKVIPYGTGGKGCFALCVSCWDELGNAAARLPYYQQLTTDWGMSGAAKTTETNQITTAVNAAL